MCSNPGSPGQLAAATADVAALLARAIDECAAAASYPDAVTEPDLAGRLAALWAIVVAADPELAASTARYAAL